MNCWVRNTTDRTNPAQYLWNHWKVVFESLPPLTSQYLPWQRSTLIFNNRSPSGIGVGTNNPFTCPSSASPSPSYPSSVLHFLHSKELRQYKLDENLLVFCRKKLNYGMFYLYRVTQSQLTYFKYEYTTVYNEARKMEITLFLNTVQPSMPLISHTF